MFSQLTIMIPELGRWSSSRVLISIFELILQDLIVSNICDVFFAEIAVVLKTLTNFAKKAPS